RPGRDCGRGGPRARAGRRPTPLRAVLERRAPPLRARARRGGGGGRRGGGGGLARGGVLLLSVPYGNGVRRLSAPWLERDARRTRAGGGQFYQFAFTRAEVRRFVEAAGFQVRAFHPYDPARILRGALRRVRRARSE